MRIEFRADHHAGPDHLAHPGKQIAFAVVVAIGNHCAVQAEQHDIDG
jgi:hypothetical protein